MGSRIRCTNGCYCSARSLTNHNFMHITNNQMNIRHLHIWGEEVNEVAKILVGKGYSDAYIEAVMWAGETMILFRI